ncbi:MAG: AbgT family transporter [Gammaproteobacteria bacterium]|nr:AbgT family transporter [Gammaproteobacteria bacterium]
MTQLDYNGQQTKGMLGWIERTGNKLPDPVFLFFGLILILVVISVLASLLGLSAQHPTQVDANGSPVIIHAASLLSAANIRRFLVEMPMTFTYFAPLGMVLVVMLGAGVAERSGLFATAMTAFVKKAPALLLTPAVAFMGMMGNLAADAAYVVLVPLAGVIFAAAGRHPIAGIAAAFAGVSGGFSANLLPGQLDALLLGLTQTAAQTIDPAFTVNIAGNWYFIAVMLVVFLPVIWYLTDKVIEPRLTPLTANSAGSTLGTVQAESADGVVERRGMARAGYAALGVVALWVVLFVMPGTPLIEEEAAGGGRLQPFYQSLIAGFLILFLACGWAYGSATGSVKSHRDIVRMMSESMGDMAYYLVLAFAAAHFVAMFSWSNLGLILAVNGAGLIQSVELPMTALLLVIVLTTTLINLFIGSASAKWGLLAPVLVPMLMLLGVSPEMATATYRVGDGATNIITPLMPYFALILTFCQRWSKDFGIGSLVATMIPYSIWLLVSGMAMVVIWILFGLPLGPGVGTGYSVGG